MLRPFGAVLGATILVGGLELFRVAADTRLLIYGIVLLLLVRFRPTGLWTLPLPFAGLVRRIRGGGTGGPPAERTPGSTGTDAGAPAVTGAPS